MFLVVDTTRGLRPRYTKGCWHPVGAITVRSWHRSRGRTGPGRPGVREWDLRTEWVFET